MVSKNFEILISNIAKSNMLKSKFFLNYINNYFSMSVHTSCIFWKRGWYTKWMMGTKSIIYPFFLTLLSTSKVTEKPSALNYDLTVVAFSTSLCGPKIIVTKLIITVIWGENFKFEKWSLIVWFLNKKLIRSVIFKYHTLDFTNSGRRVSE